MPPENTETNPVANSAASPAVDNLANTDTEHTQSEATNNASSSSTQRGPGVTFYLLPVQDSMSFPSKRLYFTPEMEIKIGRVSGSRNQRESRQDNGVFICDVMSREHAVLREMNGKIFIRDMKSTHGTFVNNQRLGDGNSVSDLFQLQHTDVITFGHSVRRNQNLYKHLSAYVWFPTSNETEPPKGPIVLPHPENNDATPQTNGINTHASRYINPQGRHNNLSTRQGTGTPIQHINREGRNQQEEKADRIAMETDSKEHKTKDETVQAERQTRIDAKEAPRRGNQSSAKETAVATGKDTSSLKRDVASSAISNVKESPQPVTADISKQKELITGKPKETTGSRSSKIAAKGKETGGSTKGKTSASSHTKDNFTNGSNSNVPPNDNIESPQSSSEKQQSLDSPNEADDSSDENRDESTCNVVVIRDNGNPLKRSFDEMDKDDVETYTEEDVIELNRKLFEAERRSKRIKWEIAGSVIVGMIFGAGSLAAGAVLYGG